MELVLGLEEVVVFVKKGHAMHHWQSKNIRLVRDVVSMVHLISVSKCMGYVYVDI